MEPICAIVKPLYIEYGRSAIMNGIPYDGYSNPCELWKNNLCLTDYVTCAKNWLVYHVLPMTFMLTSTRQEPSQLVKLHSQTVEQKSNLFLRSHSACSITLDLFWSVVSTTCRSLSQRGCKPILATLPSRKLTLIWFFKREQTMDFLLFS